MRHLKSGKKLGMDTDRRVAMLRSMAHGLIMYGRLETTVLRAKVLRGFIEPLITKGKKGDLSAIRCILRKLPNKAAVKRLVSEISPKFAGRPGGYTRVIHTGQRKGDNAATALIEFTETVESRGNKPK
jgi:large subunit ribosomal protein L17